MCWRVARSYAGRTMTDPSPYPTPLPPTPPWAATRTHGGATAALVLGILGLSVLPGLGVVAWILGSTALREIDADPQGGWSNRDHAHIGKILGIVGTVLFVGLILLLLCYFGFIVALVAGSATA
ncbi:MAG: DUF4190 domain-containing protein [Kytococcus sp.]|nr:DUF4190 domain-containing protein [Kytococcus sp.]HBO54729.1 DUF4190 domain-containing protein [Janibacter terrae]